MPEITDPLWIWNDKLKRYRNTQNGQFIGIDRMNELRDTYMQQQKTICATYAEKYRMGNISLQQLESNVKDLLKSTYIDMYAMGAGGRNSMTQKDWGKIGSMLKEQYGASGYLKGFMEQIAMGNLSEAQIAARLNMYVNSANEALWKGYANDLPLNLPAHPGDGSTICLTACRCSWFIAPVEGGYDCYWRLGQAEHCPDCMRRASDWAPYRIRVSGGE